MTFMQLVRDKRRVVLAAHHSPDGDAVGSTLAWASYLRSIGKQTTIILPNPYPDFLRWMPDSQFIKFYEGHEAECKRFVDEADLVCLLDLCRLDRMRNLGPVIGESRAPRIIIDHHLDPDTSAATFLVSRPQASSTCELVFRLIWQLGGYETMPRNVAADIYTGIMTDTGNFSYASSDPEVYLILAYLLKKNIDKDRIYRHVYHSFTENRLRFTGYVLNEKLKFYCSHRASIFTITREEMKRFHFLRGDAEGLVNLPLQVRGMKLSISLREDTDKEVVRVSLRSVDDFPCNTMAEQFFNGGGHKNASGGELPFPIEEAVQTAERAIEAFKDML